MHLLGKVGDSLEFGELAADEIDAGHRAMSWHHGAGGVGEEPGDRRGPVHRETVAEPGGRVVLEQIAGEKHVRVRHDDHDVGVGVATPDVQQVNAPAAEIDDRRFDEGPFRWVHHDRAEIIGEEGHGPGDPRPHLFGSRDQAGPASLVTPDRGRPELAIPEGVVPVPVGVHDVSNRMVGDTLDVRDQLPGVGRR